MGVGLVISGVTTYGYLVLAARALGPDRYAGVSTLWATTLLLALGCFLPVEQEVARAVSARRHVGAGARPVVRRAGQVGALLAAVLLAGLLIGFPIIRRELFDGNAALVACLAVSVVAYLASHLARGSVSGVGRFGDYSLLLGGESVIRLALCAALFAAGVDRAAPYGFVLALAPLAAVALVLARRPSLGGDGPPAPTGEVTLALGRLVAAAVLAQALVNGPPVAVQVLARADESAVAGRFLAGLIIARVPIFLFAAIGAPLLPRLSALATGRQMDEFKQVLARLLWMVTAVGAAAVIGATTLGPWVLRVFFGREFQLERIDFLFLAAASAAYLIGLVLAQGLIALEAHTKVAIGWLVGVVVFLVTLINRASLVVRVEVAFCAGAVGAALALAVLLSRAGRQSDARSPRLSSQ